MKYFRSTRLCDLPLTIAEVQKFELTENFVENIKQLDFDVLDIHPDDFDRINSSELSKNILMTDEVFRSGYPDCIVRKNGQLSYYNFMQRACMSVFEERSEQLDNSKAAALIGNELLLSSMAPFLFKLGYSKLILLTENEAKAMSVAKTLQRFFFGTEIVIQSLQDKDRIEINEVISFLVSDYHFCKKEILNNLVYFSFLVSNSTIIDLRSHEDSFLAEEGARFNHYTIHADKLFQARFKALQEFVKTRP